MADLSDLAHRLRAAVRGGLHRAHHAALDTLAEDMVTDAQANARDRMVMRSWALHDSIDAHVDDDFDGLSATLTAGTSPTGQDGPHAIYQERGTRTLRPQHYLRDAFHRATRRGTRLLLQAGAAVLSDE